MPLGDVGKGIDADQQEQPICFLERLFEALQGIDRVIRFCRFPAFPFRPVFFPTVWLEPGWSLEQRRDEFLLLRRGQRDHGVTMGKRRERLALFMRRHIRWHESPTPALVRLARRARQCQMSAMDGIKATAEETYIHAPLVSSFVGSLGKRQWSVARTYLINRIG